MVGYIFHGAKSPNWNRLSVLSGKATAYVYNVSRYSLLPTGDKFYRKIAMNTFLHMCFEKVQCVKCVQILKMPILFSAGMMRGMSPAMDRKRPAPDPRAAQQMKRWALHNISH